MIKEIKKSFSKGIIFILEDGRQVEMSITGRESRMGVLGKNYESQMDRNRKDVADLFEALQEALGVQYFCGHCESTNHTSDECPRYGKNA